MTKAKVINGKLVFSSLLAEFRFLKAGEGKDVTLEIDDKPTPEMRKYFEGCLVPAFFYFHPHSGWSDFKDAREVLKLQFLPNVRQVRLIVDGETVKVAPSLGEISKERYGNLVESVTQWMEENGMPIEVIDSQAYLKWRDTNFVDLIYPPLSRLKQSYDREKAKGAPKPRKAKSKIKSKTPKGTRRAVQSVHPAP